MIFRTITDDITGANKSIGLFGKSLNDFKGIINSFKQNGFVNTLLNTPLINIDTDAIDSYNDAIKSGMPYEQALAEARGTTNANTLALIESSHGAEVQIERVTAAQKASTIAAKAHSVALKAASVVGNMILFAAITKGIELATTAIDNWIHRVEKANEAMDEAVGEYESAKSSLESVNTELEEQNKKLDELLAKDKLTYAEKGQLEELQAITQELLLQQDIEEKRADKASKEAADKAVDAYEKQYGRYDKTEKDLQEKLSYENFPIPEDANDVLGMIAAYIRAQELLEQSQKEFDEAVKNGEDTTWFAENVQYNIDAVDEYKQALDENISDLQEKRLALEDEYNKAIEKRESGTEPLTSSEKDVIETYESIYDVMRMVYEYTDKNTWKSMQIESVFDTEGIEKTKEELIEMVKAGEFDESTLQSYPKLSAALEQNKVSASELRNELEALAEAEGNIQGNVTADEMGISSLSITQTIDQLNTQLKPAFDSLKSAYQDIFTTDDDGKPLFTLENVDLSMLDSIKSAIDDLNENEELGISIDYSSFETLANVLTNSKSTADDVRNAINGLAGTIVQSLNPSLQSTSVETYQLTKSMLESLGVANAEEVMISALGYSLTELSALRKAASDAGFDLANATDSEISMFIWEQTEAGNCAQELYALQLKKVLLNSTTINTSADIEYILGLANSAGIASNALVKLAEAKQMLDTANANGDVRGIYEAKKYANQLRDEIQNDVISFKVPEINFDGTDKSKSSKSGGSSSKSEKDLWLEEYKRKLEELKRQLNEGRLMPSSTVMWNK